MRSGRKRLVCLNCSSEFDSGLELCPNDGSKLKQVARDLLEGTIFAGKYEIISLLGSGGMGSVYKARHVFLDKQCAVKILHSHYLSNTDRIKRFMQEARTIAALSHPNLISVHEFAISESGEPFLEMDFLEGFALQQVIEAEGQLSTDEFVEIFQQVLNGLSHAHKHGVIHRDLKPSNIMLVGERPRATAKVVDFGIAKLLSETNSGGQKITKTGELLGSPIYMSPEQWLAEPIDARSDIYSLGCVMFECLTGQPPYRGGSLFETMNMHLRAELPFFRAVAPSATIPDAFEELVHKAMSKQPSRRFQTAEEFKEGLDYAVRFSGGSPLPRKVRRILVQLMKEPPRQAVRARIIRRASMAVMFLISFVLAAHLLFPGGLQYLGDLADWKYHEVAGYIHLHQARQLARTDQAKNKMSQLNAALAEFRRAQLPAEKYSLQEYPFNRLMQYKNHLHLGQVYAEMGRQDLARAQNAKAYELNPEFVAAPAGH
jgi:serine/threonine-protein kinase